MAHKYLLAAGFNDIIKPVVATDSRDIFMNMGKKITVGILASETGCNVETVRYYEKSGLMPEPPRSGGGHRLYSFDHVKRLTFIRRCRELGFSIKQVKKLLALIDEPGHGCGEVKAQALAHVVEIQEKIEDLRRLEKVLQSMSEQCREDEFSAQNCPIIESLYNW